MRFSQRIGRKPTKVAIQTDSMDGELRTALWNCFQVCILEDFAGPSQTEVLMRSLEVSKSYRHFQLGNSAGFFRKLWADHFKLPLYTLPDDFDRAVKAVRERFFELEWYEVYDFLEFTAQVASPQEGSTLIQRYNEVLERELAGYRFVDTQITPIVDEVEIGAIKEALAASQRPRFAGVHSHLKDALSKLSDRKNPDYRNSIKESISAVEAAARVITARPNATLGDALKLIEDTVGLHPALKKGFVAIYGYTSDADGIRHSMIDESKCDFEDAKYMLVSCAAFVNYLIMKATKAGRVS